MMYMPMYKCVYRSIAYFEVTNFQAFVPKVLNNWGRAKAIEERHVAETEN